MCLILTYQFLIDRIIKINRKMVETFFPHRSGPQAIAECAIAAARNCRQSQVHFRSMVQKQEGLRGTGRFRVERMGPSQPRSTVRWPAAASGYHPGDHIRTADTVGRQTHGQPGYRLKSENHGIDCQTEDRKLFFPWMNTHLKKTTLEKLSLTMDAI